MERTKQQIIQETVDLYNVRIEIAHKKKEDCIAEEEKLITERDNYILVMQD